MKADREEAFRVLDIEARALVSLKEKIGESFEKSLDLLQGCQGKVVVSGMGKSGIIARKIAATLSSTGTPAIYLHPGESSHGDLGLLTRADVLLGISYSGETAELTHLLTYAARKNIPVIAITGKSRSSLGQAATYVLDVGVQEEACPLGLAPTASTTATLAMGDALAMCLLKRRGFRAENFAELHPSGSLGAKLLTRVRDVMHTGDALALVTKNDGMRNVIQKMTAKEVRGIAGVVDEKGDLIGVITDGDLRRRLEKSQNPLDDLAGVIMTAGPKTIDVDEMAERALFAMENHAIQSLFVVDKSSASAMKPIGLLHLQDLLRAKVR